VEALLPCTVANVVKYWGLAGTVKSNKSYQIIREEEPQYT
jgi:flagellar motor switch protein FliM